MDGVFLRVNNVLPVNKKWRISTFNKQIDI